jgi:hypothetical protein
MGCFSAVSVITKHFQIINGFGETSICTTNAEIEKAIVINLASLVIARGVHCKGIVRPSFITNAKYAEPSQILDNKEEDYDFNADVMNYAYSVISLVADRNKLNDLGDNDIIVIEYSEECEVAMLTRYSSLEDFQKVVYEECLCEDKTTFRAELNASLD